VTAPAAKSVVPLHAGGYLDGVDLFIDGGCDLVAGYPCAIRR
jgi:hypothetical protein